MFLNKLSVINFKNLGEVSLDFSSRINCFVGDNGAGKTNVVDAVHYLSMCKSSLTMTDTQCVRHDEDFFMLDARYSTDTGRSETVVCSFRKGAAKTIRRNGKEYGRISEHIGLVPLVLVSPADSFLVTDSADERRRFLNSFLSQLDKSYLAALIRYNHIIGERNKLLKSNGFPSGEMLDIFDLQLAEVGKVIHGHRKALIEKLSPLVAEYYKILSDDREQVELRYKSELNEKPFEELLVLSREKDRINQFTTCGIHRDDIKMKIGGHALKKFGSQGQQKSLLIALKLAQYTIVARQKEEKPILLLDDVFDKLDMHRVEKLLSLVSGEEFGQIFITDCNKERLETILEKTNEPYTLFTVSDGKIETA